MERKFVVLKISYINSGSCNGCDIELLDAFTLYADTYGIKYEVVNYDECEALIITGPITRQSSVRILNMISNAKKLKNIIAIGSCACSGGIWYDSFSTWGGVEYLLNYLKSIGRDVKVIYIPGCPPKPQMIMYGILLAEGKVSSKIIKEVHFAD
ncbi:MAG: NADH:ubiquinone oxidoreductase [Thermoprotei archaeon ex4572_64]|nr:MAG: NADH:ubiquinone oxidoreductase [Thermoprotei archaeon ex4572_64]